VSERRYSFLNRPSLMRLDLACEPLSRAYDAHVYLVGSCLLRPDFRDVDVRVLLSRADWDGMFPGADPGKPFMHARWEVSCLAYSALLASQTGLPIDFQFQETEAANAEYPGMRSALGIRTQMMTTGAEP